MTYIVICPQLLDKLRTVVIPIKKVLFNQHLELYTG